jgi:colanic acid/amylovoran biosynthesis protein
MKLLLINLHSSRNAGDAVLTDVSVDLLREAFPGAELTLAMNDPGSYSGPGRPVGSFMAWLKQGRRWRWWAWLPFLVASLLALLSYRWRGRPAYCCAPADWRRLLQAYFEADLVVSCAGNFLYSSGRLGLAFQISIFTMVYALWAGKPLYMLPQTIGPLRRGWERALVRRVVGRMRLAYVRDAPSLKLLESLGLDQSRCRLAPDVAFLYQPAGQEQARALLAEQGLDPAVQRPLLGMTLLDWGAQYRLFSGQAAYEAAMAGLARHFISHHQGYVILFSQVQGPTAAEDDRLTAGRLYRTLGDCDGRLAYIDRPVAPTVLRAAYGYMDLFVGTRLHSNIFALSAGVPVLAVQYQYKTRGVLETLDLARWVQPIDTISETALIDLLDQLWRERQQVRQQLQQVMPGIMRQAGAVGREIATDWGKR